MDAKRTRRIKLILIRLARVKDFIKVGVLIVAGVRIRYNCPDGFV